ncbi:MAG: primosomal protein N', partial [Campylobacterales bacterium]
TYSSKTPLSPGAVVKVPLRGRVKEGVVVAEVPAPPFKTLPVEGVVGQIPPIRWKFLQFISYWHWVSIGEAFSLFYSPTGPELSPQPLLSIDTPIESSIKYTPQQQRALQELVQHQRVILFGDTGSGKTELYIELIKRTLEKGRTSLFLLPEIAITAQMEKRLEGHFKPGEIGVWHSKIPKKRRREIVEGLQKGEIKVVVGARSALFLPFRELGLIVVDEFHDDSYKSEGIPRYNGKNLALYLSSLYNCRVVLGSGTPAVADYHRFPVVRLKGTYFQSEKVKEYWPTLGGVLEEEIKKEVERGKQVILFIPTRGNFKYFICSQCGESLKCPNCEIPLTLHRRERVLRCHYCNWATPIPDRCPTCGSGEFLTKRPGTKEVVERLKAQFPEWRIGRMDSDSITSKGRLDRLVEQFEKGDIQILVGTQMVAKGHNFPNVSLSIVLGVDFLLNTPDYRAGERAFNLVKQVEGRSGRRGFGRVLVETHHPHFFNRKWEEFYREEIQVRELLGYPPFQRLIRIEIESREQGEGEELLRELERRFLEGLGSDYWRGRGVEGELVSAKEGEPPKLRGKYRFQILLKGKNLHPLLYHLLPERGEVGRGVKIVVDPSI